MDVTKEMKAYLKHEGASVVGVAPVSRFDDAPVGHRPTDLLPGAKSVVSIGLKLPNHIVNWEGRLARSQMMPDDDVRWEVESGHWYARCGYEAMNTKTEQLGLMATLYFEERGHEALFFPATYAHNAPIMQKVRGYFAPFSHRHAAVRAGLGEFGYNNLVITPKYGPRIRFMSVLTSAELTPDPLLDKPVCLGKKCLLCIKACGVPRKDLHAIAPATDREDGQIFLNMPSVVDKPACFTKYHGEARCWGKCISACPIGH